MQALANVLHSLNTQAQKVLELPETGIIGEVVAFEGKLYVWRPDK